MVEVFSETWVVGFILQNEEFGGGGGEEKEEGGMGTGPAAVILSEMRT